MRADRGIECPACGTHYPPTTKRCDCGAWLDKSASSDKGPVYHTCEYCGQERRWYRFKTETGYHDTQRLVGRSISGGYVCMPCYQRRPDREFGPVDAKRQRLSEGNDEIGAMIRASHGPMSSEDRRDILKWAREVIQGLGTAREKAA